MRIKIAVAVSVVLVLGAACDGGEPSPTTLPTAPPPTVTTGAPTTASPTPTPSAPTLPAAARADTPAGAQAFARFWLTTLAYAYKTGDTEPLRSLGGCQGCVAQADAVDAVYRAGGRIDGGSIRVIAARTIRHVREEAALVRVEYSQAAGSTISGDGSSSARLAIQRASLLFTLAQRHAGWTLTAIQPLRAS